MAYKVETFGGEALETDIQLLKAKMKYHRRTYEEVAKAMGINRDTFARRLKSKNFSVQELHGLMKAVPLTMSEVEEIFFKKEKSAVMHHSRHEDSFGISQDEESVPNLRKCVP